MSGPNRLWIVYVGPNMPGFKDFPYPLPIQVQVILFIAGLRLEFLGVTELLRTKIRFNVRFLSVLKAH